MSADEPLRTVLHEWAQIFMRRSFHDFKRFINQAGLSPSQAAALMRLYHCDVCGVSDIAGHLGFTRPAASQMIDRLVQQGLLQRSEALADRRFKQVSLTDQGRALIESGIAARQDWLEQLAAAFTPEERAAVAAALTLLTEAANQLERDQE